MRLSLTDRDITKKKAVPGVNGRVKNQPGLSCVPSMHSLPVACRPITSLYGLLTRWDARSPTCF